VVALAEGIKEQKNRIQSLMRANSMQACSQETWSRDEATTFPMKGNRRQERLCPSVYQSPTTAVTGTEHLAGVYATPSGISKLDVLI